MTLDAPHLTLFAVGCVGIWTAAAFLLVGLYVAARGAVRRRDMRRDARRLVVETEAVLQRAAGR